MTATNVLPDSQVLVMVLIMTAITFLIRSLPFLLFPGSKKTPPYIDYLGRVLPYAIIGMLVVYCFKNTEVLSAPFGVPELIAGVSVVLLHAWKRNTLLSIAGGTVLYMFLVQAVF